MEARAQGLRRQIASYRRLLAEGVPSDMAIAYLAEIAKFEAELAQIAARQTRNAVGPDPG